MKEKVKVVETLQETNGEKVECEAMGRLMRYERKLWKLEDKLVKVA